MTVRKGFGEYPPGWPAFARQLKDAAGWRCVRCSHPHDPAAGYTLTTHHLTMNKAESFAHWWAFVPLCQRCHLSIQSRVFLDRPWVMTAHSDWFKPYAGGYFAWKYLGRAVSRADVVANLDWYADIERRCFAIGLEMADVVPEAGAS